ncbi:hypothetical protein RCL1_003420 [Eukaryota sp. TZLM3-RCL]
MDDFTFDLDVDEVELPPSQKVQQNPKPLRKGELISSFSLHTSATDSTSSLSDKDVSEPESSESEDPIPLPLPESQASELFDYEQVPVSSFGLRFLQSFGLQQEQAEKTKSCVSNGSKRMGLGFSDTSTQAKTFKASDVNPLVAGIKRRSV